MGHPNLGRWLSRIPNETLVVWGEKDRMMPASQAAIWAERIPNARVLIVPDVGHFAMQEEPATVTAIGDFLAGGPLTWGLGASGQPSGARMPERGFRGAGADRTGLSITGGNHEQADAAQGRLLGNQDRLRVASGPCPQDRTGPRGERRGQ